MSFQYIVFHKPYNVLSQFSGEGEKKTLADYLEGIAKDIYPAGRLDYDSEGLLLLTNDKQLLHELTDPKHGHKRTYWVQVDGNISEEATKQLRQGVDINLNGKRYRTLPSQVDILKEEPHVCERNPPIRYRANIPTSWIALTLTEGKNRQVRRMTAAVGFPTLRLIRCCVDCLCLGDLAPGEYRIYGREFREMLKNT